MTNGDHGLLLVLVLVVVVMRRMRMMMMMMMRWWRWWWWRSCVNGYGEKGGPTERTGFRVYVDVVNSRVDKRIVLIRTAQTIKTTTTSE